MGYVGRVYFYFEGLWGRRGSVGKSWQCGSAYVEFVGAEEAFETGVTKAVGPFRTLEFKGVKVGDGP